MSKSRFLRINFFPLRNSTFIAKCWMRECTVPDEPRPDDDYYLFSGDRNQDGKPRWLTTTQKESCQQMEITSTGQPLAVRWLCARMLLHRIADDINSTGRYKAEVVEKFRPQLEVKVKRHDGLGWQGFIAEFDWNSQLRRHGLYVNFHFFRDDGCTDTKRIRQDKRKTGVIVTGVSRTGMEMNLMSLLHEGAITFDDLEGFSEELQDRLREVCGRGGHVGERGRETARCGGMSNE